MKLEHTPQQSMGLRQSLFAGDRMEQAFTVLKMPLTELAPYLQESLTQNPLLEELYRRGDSIEVEEFRPLNFTEEDFSFVAPFAPFLGEDEIPSSDDEQVQETDTLVHHLLVQAERELAREEDVVAALFLIGSLEEDGLLKTPLEEIAAFSFIPKSIFEKILPVLKEFDPPGVFCQSIQEALLKKLPKDGLAYTLVKNDFQSLLTKDYKKLLRFAPDKVALKHALKEIERHPLGAEKPFSPNSPPPLFPDLTIDENGAVEVEESSLPLFVLKTPSLDHLDKEDRAYMKEQIQRGKWLLKNLEIRRETLRRIGEAIFFFQSSFFESSPGKLVPLTLNDVSEKIHLHPSTIARAIQNKWIETPRGILPLEAFFPDKIQTSDLSSEAVKEGLIHLIKEEDKAKPFTDEEISKKLHCSRRVITKYRKLLNIPSSAKRKLILAD